MGREAPSAVEVRDLEKTFRIPTHRVDSLKERIAHPFAASEERVLRALDGISFDVREGEFFGIVGRNGSGKSTLLKLLASIYRADAGTIRVAGRLAPFIELGVGFNVDLSARENVVLNGVMMGLTPVEARSRLDAVVEFAELSEFIDLKLKNYSSGMLVRLAFSLMIQVDADVLLIDEVLAVGDAAFQQKCTDVFHDMKAEGKTVILVTHEMSAVEEYCHRAMLMDRGAIRMVGDPAEVGREYLQLNFEQALGEDHPLLSTSGEELRLIDAWLEDDDGARIENVEHGAKFGLRAELEVLRDTPGLGVAFGISNSNGISVFEFGVNLMDDDDEFQPIAAGERVSVRAEVENLLSPGRYFVHIGVNRAHGAGVALYVQSAVGFVVFGGSPHLRGIVALPHEIEASAVRGGGR